MALRHIWRRGESSWASGSTIDQANAQLQTALPLLGLNGSNSIDKIVGFVDSFGGLAQSIHDHLVGFTHSTPTLQDVIDKINSILSTQLPQISTGIDNQGEKLNAVMPRWKLSQRDLHDVAAYVLTLK